MRIRIVGAGPAGLYFAALMKRRDPSHDIVLLERNPRDATWGFGVVFSDRALEFLRADDEALCRLPDAAPRALAGHHDRPQRHGDPGRRQRVRVDRASRAPDAPVRLRRAARRDDPLRHRGAVARRARRRRPRGRRQRRVLVHPRRNEERFGTRTDWRPNRFIWYGSTKAFNSLTLTFRETALGVFCAHHYRYRPDRSTFLVEVTQDTYARAGFDTMAPDDALRHCERVFASDLDGHPILSNQSQWRRFPAIWNERWSDGNVVLLGDALRTAHFSIGSGTRLAMEDAVALFKAFVDAGDDVPVALALFQRRRLPPMKTIWDAANTSMRWYERMDDLVPSLTPVELAYSYMTRTGRVDHDEVRRRDPRLAAAYASLHPDVDAAARAR